MTAPRRGCARALVLSLSLAALPGPALLLAQSAATAVAVTAAAASAAAGSLAEGERLFRENRPAEALPFLERAVRDNPAEERAWIYLGTVQQMLGRPEEAVNALRRGLPQARGLRHLFYYNMGNAYLIQGKASFAEEMYAQAMGENPSFAPSFLNRGNARISLANYREAAADYRRYLELDPASPQRTAIEEVIRRIGAVAEEADRKAAEAELKRLAELAARQALLDEVAASLKAAAEETTNLSAGSGAVQGYGDEFTLDE